jgi:hypothetical protein
MGLLSATELKRIERKHAAGINSGSVVEIFKKKGERFSEPSLRKYIQLGLLPTSRRVGTRGRHRGSSGLYPVIVVRLINEIKRALQDGATLDELRFARAGVLGELQALVRAADVATGRLREAIRHQEKKKRAALKRDLDIRIRALNKELKALDRFTIRLGPGQRP